MLKSSYMGEPTNIRSPDATIATVRHDIFLRPDDLRAMGQRTRESQIQRATAETAPRQTRDLET
jgi:hypothetical protein